MLSGKFTDPGVKESCHLKTKPDTRMHATTRRAPVRFEYPFKSVPKVLVSVTRLHTTGGKHVKCEIHASEITTKGFMLVYKIFSEACVEDVEANWMAMG
eukprot:g3674.t1